MRIVRVAAGVWAGTKGVEAAADPNAMALTPLLLGAFKTARVYSGADDGKKTVLAKFFRWFPL
jgi:hypothetical protein